MESAYIPRKVEKTLLKLADGFPVLALTGPRQSGKTTLARHLFGDRPYVSLEDPDNREFARVDPRGFLARYADGAVFDEVQRVPELFSWLQGVVDESGRMGRFVLTGSRQFGLMEGISQSLAGRVGGVTLLPLCLPELERAGGANPALSLDEILYRGLYPAVHVREVGATHWYNSYIQTYLERDVRAMMAVQSLSAFQTFLRLCAGRSGQVLNLSALGAEAGVSHNTAKAWLSVLQASFVVHLLQPFHKNYNKRLIKSPKLYFHDVGLAARLLGISEAAQITAHPLRGALFETLTVSEAIKSFCNRALPPSCFYWRDAAGHEVDLIVEEASGVLPVEIKSGTTVASDFFGGLRRWGAMTGEAGGALIYGGSEAYEREGFRVIPWRRSHEAAELAREG